MVRAGIAKSCGTASEPVELPLAAEIDPVAVQAGGATVLRIIGGKTGLPWLRRD